jgi:MSHA biogenesis protein MshO
MKQRGFTLLEIVVAITIASIVVVFAGMFMVAPVDAFEAQSDRSAMVGELEAAWPRMREDLRTSLPNSIRWRRNGRYVAVEMLAVQGASRYVTAMGSPFTAAGNYAAADNTVGLFTNLNRNVVNETRFYVSVNNRGEASVCNAYTLSGSMTAVRPRIDYTTAANGEGQVTLQPAPSLAACDSPRHRVYLVSEPVTYLCDESQGTLRRYSGYTISAAQAARDAPNEFGGAANELIARGVSRCTPWVSGQSDAGQDVSITLNALVKNDTVTLQHSLHQDYAP